MKKLFVLGVLLLTSLLLIPLSATTALPPSPAVLQTNAPLETTPQSQTVKVLISKTKKTEEIPLEDYLFGVVAGEMPALYDTEALKAQVVCANTFLQWRKQENSDKEYDITDDFTIDQCYISKHEADEKWGSKAEEYQEKIKNAIEQVKNQTLTYNGEIILSVYHSVSSGMTESAKNVWGKDYPYLQAVKSDGDTQATNHTSQVDFTAEQIKTALGIKTLDQNSFLDITRTESGTVKTVKISGKEYKGSDIRAALGLKSSNFKVTYQNQKYTFTTFGYGHGVGMSQNGANEMAKDGKTYIEILKHYYTGVEIFNA